MIRSEPRGANGHEIPGWELDQPPGSNQPPRARALTSALTRRRHDCGLSYSDSLGA